MSTTTDLSAKTLGQIALIQGMVANLPTLDSILSFVCRGLEIVPGIESITYQIIEGKNSDDKAAEKNGESYQRFVIHYKDEVYGELLVRLSEYSQFKPYIPYIDNLSLMLAVVCEERRQHAMIESYRDELEKRVHDRTKQLKKEIEERKQVEDSLRKSERKFQTIFEQAAVGVALIESKTGHFLRINRRYCEIVGYTVDEMAENKTFHNITHPDDLHLGIDYMNRLIAGEIQEFAIEKRYWHKNGSIVWVKLTVSPTWKPGEEPKSHIAVVEDITARKKSEVALQKSAEQLKKIFIAAKEVSFIITDAQIPDPIILEFSPGAEKIFGYKRAEMIGQGVSALHLSEDVAKFPDAHKKMKEGLTGFTGEATLVRKTGEKFPAFFSTYPLADENGIMYATLGVSIDISKQKKLEAQLQHTQKMEAISTLAGGLAHDFNNMLGVITGNLSFALSEIERNNDLYSVLVDVLDSAKQAKSLTHQLLTFAKGGEPIKETIDLNKLVEESAGFVTRGAQSKCEFNFADSLWPVDADPGQINQVVSNLAINASQAMPGGGIVYLRTKNVEIDKENALQISAGRYVKVTVEDQGVGIDKKYLPNIFDPYFSTKQKGSGLGLAITFSIIKKHGGHIFVYSEVGKGTVFDIYLPASEQDISKTRDKKTISHRGQGRILVMDDQEEILKMAGRLLNRMGYEAEFAVEGSEAIEKFREAHHGNNPFDIVILDLTIPGGMGGAKTIVELLKIDPNVKALVSSGYSNDPVMANYKEYGFYDVLPKPYTKVQMAEILSTISTEN